MGMRESYFWCLVVLIICIGFTSVQAGEVSARSLQESTNCQSQQSIQYYSIPPFAVQFTTLDVNEIPAVSNVVISETDAKASSLTYPLKVLTEEFIVSKFRERINSMNLSSSSSSQQMYHDYYRQLTEVELRVILKHNPKVTDIAGHVALIATLHGTLHFSHSSGCGGTTLVPSQDDITITFGAWLESILETNRNEYLQRLLASNQEMLKEIVDFQLVPNYFQDGTGGESWLMAVWVVLAILGLCGLGAALVWMMRGKPPMKSFVGGSPYDPNHHSPAYTDDDVDSLRLSSQLDSKQHGMNESAHRRHSLDILNKSEEYLTKHRPDWTEGGGHPQGNFTKPFGNIMSLFDLSTSDGSNHSVTNTPEKTPRGRRSFATRQRSSIELQAGNIAAANSEDPSPFDDVNLNQSNHEAYSPGGRSHEEEIMMAAAAQSSAYRPISSIWRSVTSAFQGSSSYNENDGIMTNANFFYDGNEDEYFAKLEEDRLQEEQWLTFLKEEEQNYNFAFKDFPRKDGTPCLMYDGSNENEADAIFNAPLPKESTTGEEEESDIFNAREVLSDEAFRQLLHMNVSPSFEETLESPSPALPVTYKSPEFNERLSSLFAEKHRQYEKRSIVERHQQKRKKEREMERRERQKDMHRELEALEAGMAMSDKWRAKHHVSPRPYDLSPARPSYSPNIHVRKSPARRSPVPPSGGRRSPVPPPGARRSPVPPMFPMTHSIPPRHVASKSIDTLDSDSSLQLIRPRMSRPPSAAPPSELFLTDSHRYHEPLTTDLDPSSLDKLSMPAMSKNPKHPSPSSVLDDLSQIPPTSGSLIPPRNPAAIHRRNNSIENPQYTTPGTGQRKTIASMTPPRRAASPRFGTRGMSPIRHSTGTRGVSPARSVTRGVSPARSVNSTTRGMSPARHGAASPSSRGRRPARGPSPKPGPRSASNSSRHSRDGGVFDHGIAALI
ncbi:unnamed protein product [Cylindrotheca closterium]|uniref:Selenoprotein O n=1 Tax=Cylindrotheca closterium TaxID=2856 RepID=A0AAD2JN69_9STRA|nr:unnamed protein product [Cylindrotheca closterium]